MSAEVLSLFSNALWSTNVNEQLPAIQKLLGHIESAKNSTDLDYCINRLSKSLASDWQDSRIAATTCLIHLANGDPNARQSLVQNFARSAKREDLLQDAFLLFIIISTLQENDQGLAEIIERCATVYQSKAYLQDSALHALIHLLEKLRVWNVNQQIKNTLQLIRHAFFDNPTWSLALAALAHYLQSTFKSYAEFCHTACLNSEQRRCLQLAKYFRSWQSERIDCFERAQYEFDCRSVHGDFHRSRPKQ